MARPKAQVEAEQELKESSTTESSVQTQSEESKDMTAIMKGIADIAKAIADLSKRWEEDMRSIKNYARSGKF
jgi:hypothetical protein